MELFGPFRREAIERGIPADQVDRFAEQLRFAIWVGGGDRGEDVVGQSGGLPRLPAGTEWPSERGIPLPFVASLDCAALPKVEKLPLPVDGSLLFFLDPEQAFDACSRGYDAYARVLYVPAGTETAVRQLPSDGEVPRPYAEYRLYAEVVPELPPGLEPDDEDMDDPLMFASDTVKQLVGELTHTDELIALVQDLWPTETGLSSLRIGGYTKRIGGSYSPEEQMARASLRARLETEPDLPRSERIRWRREEESRLIREWVPLAQFPTEYSFHFGRFLIRFDDLAAGRFDNMRSFPAFTE
ncbi:YwqG family protein [Micromonospora sp. MA102]|uniref:YwqG family protein n=1 Tax=Micromonospora sp. MA102 TaxID=2952755 RepID=UPI0021C83339|nr:YwqG family protein [Micromonospora sp. MA102]